MQIDDLPTSPEREVPLRRCEDCRLDLGRGRDALRALGSCPRFGLPRQGIESRCIKFVAVAALAVLAGCASMTPTQKRWTAVAAGVLITGAVIAHQQDNGKAPPPDVRTPTVPCSNPEACR